MTFSGNEDVTGNSKKWMGKIQKDVPTLMWDNLDYKEFDNEHTYFSPQLQSQVDY